jgi:predicted dehydrogenase
VRTPVSVGVVGLGRWGIELARAFDDFPRADVRWVCDERPTGPARARPRGAPVFTWELDDLLADETLDAVAFATPGASRRALVRRALEADKHVYVDGPLSLRAGDTIELTRLAELRNRRLMIGHQLVYHPGVQKLKELMELGRLGEVYYLTATITTSPRSADDESVLTTEAGDAVATILYLLGDEPIRTWWMSDSYIHSAGPEVADCHLRFATGIAATLQVSWLDARDQCRIAVVGSRRTAIFDAIAPSRKVTIYEKGSPRGAEIVSPRVAVDEPLRLQCETFLGGIRGGVRAAAEYPSTRLAPAVVRVLESFAGELREPVPINGRIAARSRLRLAGSEPGQKEGASLSTKQR